MTRRLARGVTLCALPVLALWWPFPIALATARGEGAFDLTVFAYVFPFALTLVALAGWFWMVARDPRAAGVRTGTRVWVRSSLLGITISSMLILLWSALALARIAPTLAPADLIWLIAPVASLITSIRLRWRFDA